MCGISGIWSFNNLDVELSRNYTKKLLLQIMSRGRDATGIAVINTKTNEIRMNKAPLTAEEFLNNEENLRIISGEFNIVLLHTRAATSGKPENNMNNHPIYSKEHNNVLIHNGIIHNDDELIEQYSLNMDAEVDSEVILQIFNILHNTRPDKRIRKTIKKLSGSAAIALYDNKKLYLYRHTSPLSVGFMPNKNVFLFSSEKDNIENVTNNISMLYGLFKIKKQEEKIIINVLDNNTLLDIDFMSNNIDKDHVEMKTWTWEGNYKNGFYSGGYGVVGCSNNFKTLAEFRNDKKKKIKYKNSMEDEDLNNNIIQYPETLFDYPDELTEEDKNFIIKNNSKRLERIKLS